MYYKHLDANPAYQFYFDPPKVTAKGDTIDEVQAFNRALAKAKAASKIKWGRIGYYEIYETLIGDEVNPDKIRKLIEMDFEDTLRILSIKNAEIV